MVYSTYTTVTNNDQILVTFIYNDITVSYPLNQWELKYYSAPNKHLVDSRIGPLLLLMLDL